MASGRTGRPGQPAQEAARVESPIGRGTATIPGFDYSFSKWTFSLLFLCLSLCFKIILSFCVDLKC